MSAKHRPDLPEHLLRVHVGLLLALDGAVRAVQSLRDDHVCEPKGCPLCRVADTLFRSNDRLARLLERVVLATHYAEQDVGPLVGAGETELALQRVRELLDDPLPAHLAGLRRGVQRTHSN